MSAPDLAPDEHRAGANCNKTAALTVYCHKRLVLGIHGDRIAFKLKAGLARSLGNGSLNDPMHFGRLVGGTACHRFLSNFRGRTAKNTGSKFKGSLLCLVTVGVGSCGVEQNRSSVPMGPRVVWPSTRKWEAPRSTTQRRLYCLFRPTKHCGTQIRPSP